MFILTVVPIFLFAVGIFCEKTDKRLIFCIVAAMGVYTVCGLSSVGGFIGTDADKLPLIGMVIGAVPFEDLGMLDAPPAVVLIMKICSACGADPSLAALVLGIIQTLLAAYALYTQCGSSYTSAAVLTFCFLPVSFAGQSVFTAALIILCASEYIRERRFFRYAALILIAACFDMSALLMIPLYFVMIIPKPWISAAVSVIIAVALYFTDAGQYIFGFLGGNKFDRENNASLSGKFASAATPLAIAVIVAVLAVICLLMYSMFRNREGSYENLVPVLFCGACMALLAALSSSGSMWFGLSLMLTMQAAVPLAPEFKEIGRKFLGIVFPGYKMTSRLIFDGLCILALAGINVYLVFGDVFGTSAYEAALKAGFGI